MVVPALARLAAGAKPAAGSTQRRSALAADAGTGGATLLGRRSECEALDGLLTDVVSGTSRVMVLRGDAGVGKSKLLSYYIDIIWSFNFIQVLNDFFGSKGHSQP